MGYYGLGPGMRVPDQLSHYEKCLRSLPPELAGQTLDVLEKLVKNVAQNPKEEKFRRIKLDNAKIAAAVTSLPSALAALVEVGFLFDKESACLVLPAATKLSFPDHVVPIQDARDYYRKEIEKDRVAKGLSRVAPTDAKTVDPRSSEQVAEGTRAGMAWLATSC